jgi:hypothetical protein
MRGGAGRELGIEALLETGGRVRAQPVPHAGAPHRRGVEGGELTEVERAEPDCAWIHRERSRPGVTLALLHLEYLEANPGGYQYTAFCDRYSQGGAGDGSQTGVL